ncbi:MAG: hypothetical protein AAB731_05240 [Patescibacteria group bacterium]
MAYRGGGSKSGIDEVGRRLRVKRFINRCAGKDAFFVAALAKSDGVVGAFGVNQLLILPSAGALQPVLRQFRRRSFCIKKHEKREDHLLPPRGCEKERVLGGDTAHGSCDFYSLAEVLEDVKYATKFATKL